MLSLYPVNKHAKLNRTIELIFEFEDFEAAVNSKVVKDLDGIIGTWGCSDCPYSNLYLGNLKRHIETHHVRSAGYNCPTCLKFCATKNALRLHMKRYNHLIERVTMITWPCPHCHRSKLKKEVLCKDRNNVSLNLVAFCYVLYYHPVSSCTPLLVRYT